MIGYLWAVARYARRRHGLGASDEHGLFDAVELPATEPTRALPLALRSLSPQWIERLKSTKTRDFLVLRDGQVTAQWSAPGDSPGRSGRLYSITKSVLSLAWGIADAEGRVPALDEPVFRGLTPRHLLRMDSGLAFDEGFDRLNHQVRTYLDPDARRTARRSPLVDPVGQEFHYNDYHSLLLGVLLEEGLRTSGWKPTGPVHEPVAAWVWERLLCPLGMEHPGRWVTDSARSRFPKTESGLCLSAQDVAKLGLLVLHGGRVGSKALVPEAWIAASTSPENGWTGPKAFHRYRDLAWGPWLETGRGYYGWHWWGRHEVDGRNTSFSLGIHGQVLLISPRHSAVVVRLADRWALDGWWPELLLDALDRKEF